MQSYYYLRVSPGTLFKKKEYAGLSWEERWEKALANGWRWDVALKKFYKAVVKRG